jgi:hypothetical protein
MQTLTLLERVRRTTPHYLSPDVAAHAGMTLEQMQRLIGGSFHPSPDQLRALARRMSIPVPTERAA